MTTFFWLFCFFSFSFGWDRFWHILYRFNGHDATFDERKKLFEGEGDILTQVLLMFFGLRASVKIFFGFFYRLVSFLPMLISHSIVLACFFKIQSLAFYFLLDLFFLVDLLLDLVCKLFEAQLHLCAHFN